MPHHRSAALLLLAVLAVLPCAAQSPKQNGLDAITTEAVKGQLEFLASDWTEGRSTAERGAFMASDFIASIFKIYGLKPAGDWERPSSGRMERSRGPRAERTRTYFQTISFLETTPGEVQELDLRMGESPSQEIKSFGYRSDFFVSPSTVGLEVTAPVVFVGYGFADEKKGYSDYKGVDVKGKIVLRLAGYPGSGDTTSPAYRRFRPDSANQEFVAMREKNPTAVKAGAVAILEVSMEDDPARRWVDNQPFRVNLPWYEGDPAVVNRDRERFSIPGDTVENDVPVVTVTKRVANEILRGTGVSLDAFAKASALTATPDSRPLRGRTVRLHTTVKSRIVNGRNVLGVLEGEDPQQAIVVGAHYDHMGTVEGYVWNGADDNASGTVGVMTLAKACLATGVKPKRSIIFAAWTGEEKGLLGSRYFVEHPYVPLDKIMMNINFDMISRNSEDDSLGTRCSMGYTKAYGGLKTIAENNNSQFAVGIDLRIRGTDRPGGGSDHAPFAAKDIPVMTFMAGFHTDYHQPTDDVSKTAWKKMTSIIKLGFLNLWDLATQETRLEKSAP